MDRALIIGSKASAVEEVCKLIQSISSSISIAIASPSEVRGLNGVEFHSSSRTALSDIARSIGSTANGRIMLIDADNAPRREILEKILASSNNIFAASSNEELQMDELTSTLANRNAWKVSAAALSSSIFSELPENLNMTTRALLTALSICATAEFGDLESIIAKADDENAWSDSELSSILKATIQKINIEDLFPNHDWDKFDQESLSASYHSLAALFIRFSDTDAAMQCLALSDNFEDSPRSLALRGLIASMKGETLEAVASMVSSLQQYESRKKEDSKHYLVFQPTNIEEINVTLQHGLQALNDRDNEKAFEFFTTAVFNFDSFYRQYGIDKQN